MLGYFEPKTPLIVCFIITVNWKREFAARCSYSWEVEGKYNTGVVFETR